MLGGTGAVTVSGDVGTLVPSSATARPVGERVVRRRVGMLRAGAIAPNVAQRLLVRVTPLAAVPASGERPEHSRAVLVGVLVVARGTEHVRVPEPAARPLPVLGRLRTHALMRSEALQIHDLAAVFALLEDCVLVAAHPRGAEGSRSEALSVSGKFWAKAGT